MPISHLFPYIKPYSTSWPTSRLVSRLGYSGGTCWRRCAGSDSVAGVRILMCPSGGRTLSSAPCWRLLSEIARRDGPVAAKCRPEWSCDSLPRRWGFGHPRYENPVGAAGAHGLLHSPRFRSAKRPRGVPATVARVHNTVWASNGSVLAYLICRAAHVSNPTAVCTGPSTSFALALLLLHPAR